MSALQHNSCADDSVESISTRKYNLFASKKSVVLLFPVVSDKINVFFVLF